MTPSGEVEFTPLRAGRKQPFPRHESPRVFGDEKNYPFFLSPPPPPPPPPREGTGANQPFLQEIVGHHVNMHWDSWVEINPETAKRLGIKDGDWLFVESPFGKVKTRAKLYVGTMPGEVNIPLGQGHSAFGRWAKGRGVNPLDLIGEDYDQTSGLPALFTTRVKVYKA